MSRFTKLRHPRSSTAAATTHRSESGRRHDHHRSIPLLVVGLAALLVIGGGTAAYGALSRTVTLTVDGRSQEVRTFGGGSTVGDLLDSKGVSVRPGDKVNADLTDDVSDGDTVTVAYAKPVTLAVDGKVSKHTVFDPTVGKALDTLDVDPTTNAFVSAPATSKVPRQGMTLVVSSPKSLTVVVGGKKSKLTTAAPTVDAVLDEASVTLDADDEVKPGIDAYVSPDDKVRVVRIKKVTKTETTKVGYKTVVRKDPDALVGESEVVRAGKEGKNRERVSVVYADGKIRKRVVLSSEPVSKPVTQIVSKGTSTPPSSSPSGDGVWDKIAQCES
ncbi:MAG: resuscitation-promoting factor, partial [Aeromicrobium sp.]|nr:resuscitation-promoting factor [Aeromicrobium sp.]